MSRILIVDDDRQLVEVLSLALAEASHDVSVAHDGAAALLEVERVQPQVLVLDVNMPRLDGFAVLRKLRGQGSLIPILMLTSRDDEIDEALGLELGADDYVPKPFSTRVLLARIAALLRRDDQRRNKGPTTTLNAGPLALDMERMEARWRGTLLSTTVTELKLLEALVEHQGKVLSRARLLELARGDDSVVGDRLVDTYVRRLRKKLEAMDAGFDRIETVVGAGYRWKDA